MRSALFFNLAAFFNVEARDTQFTAWAWFAMHSHNSAQKSKVNMQIIVFNRSKRKESRHRNANVGLKGKREGKGSYGKDSQISGEKTKRSLGMGHADPSEKMQHEGKQNGTDTCSQIMQSL